MNIYKLLAQVNADKLPKVSFSASLQNVIGVTMGVVALISVVFIAVGGLKYVLASGDPQQIAKAKDTVLYAIIGLVLAVSTFTIISFVLSGVG